MKHILLPAITAAGIFAGSAADKVASISMELDGNGMLKESISNISLPVNSQRTPLNIPGANGPAMRFDGYSTAVRGQLPELAGTGNPSYTVTLWVAPQTYPMMSNDAPTQDKAMIAGTYDSEAKSGFGFFLGREGDLEFRYFSGGWPGSLTASGKLPLEKWTRLTAVVDGTQKKVRLYYGSELVGETKCMNTNPLPAGELRLGIDTSNGFYNGIFRLDTYNGLMDDLDIYASVVEPSELNLTAESESDLAYPASWWDDQPLRPKFHAMPSSNWMNECHGMAYSDGKYHLFFQKNGNGPYMSRLHWGHISSADLCNWKEEKIAIVPGEDYDIKGCWSGCIFTDEELTGGMPRAYYTGVDYQKARIIEANPVGDDLKEWTKAGIAIDGRPGGLTDDFRDCFVFRNGSDYYMIVGSSKEGKGVATLHKLDRSTNRWSNDGKLFWEAPSAAVGGSFWEMPNVTRIGDKWLFTVTPLGLPQGVQCLYWVGDINSDGTFSPITPAQTPGQVELNGTSREGYGLLSPTILERDGRTLAMGIVPDKLPGSDNYVLGWAHNISLPREWSLDENNRLIQKPATELTALRGGTPAYSNDNFTFGGSELLNVPSNRCEIEMSFEKNSSVAGLRFFSDGNKECLVEYIPSTNQVKVDFSNLERLVNDSWSYNGEYIGTLPEQIADGGEIKLHVFVDGSIMDIFVNDKWAFSVRVFPTGESATLTAEAFSDGNTNVNQLRAWELTGEGSGVGEYFDSSSNEELKVKRIPGGVSVSGLQAGEQVRIYNSVGMPLASGISQGATIQLPVDVTGLTIITAAGKRAAKIIL